MSDLFTLPESKSPRLLWMERHGITTKEHNGKWHAIKHTSPKHVRLTGGDTEEAALHAMAYKLQIKLWNEE